MPLVPPWWCLWEGGLYLCVCISSPPPSPLPLPSPAPPRPCLSPAAALSPQVLWRQFLKFKETELPAKESDKNRSKAIYQSLEVRGQQALGGRPGRLEAVATDPGGRSAGVGFPPTSPAPRSRVGGGWPCGAGHLLGKGIPLGQPLGGGEGGSGAPGQRRPEVFAEQQQPFLGVSSHPGPAPPAPLAWDRA